MDFITWWFEKHSFWSTLGTPWASFIYCIFKGYVWRGVVSFILAVIMSIGSRYEK